MPGADSYLATQVLTASPYRLHLMVLDGAIQFASQAEAALLEQDLETAHLAFGRCRDFVIELLGGLDESRDPELAGRMKDLFLFAYVNLVEGERDRDVKKVQDALAVLRTHHETWLELGVLLQSAEERTRLDALRDMERLTSPGKDIRCAAKMYRCRRNAACVFLKNR